VDCNSTSVVDIENVFGEDIIPAPGVSGLRPTRLTSHCKDNFPAQNRGKGSNWDPAPVENG